MLSTDEKTSSIHGTARCRPLQGCAIPTAAKRTVRFSRLVKVRMGLSLHFRAVGGVLGSRRRGRISSTGWIGFWFFLGGRGFFIFWGNQEFLGERCTRAGGLPTRDDTHNDFLLVGTRDLSSMVDCSLVGSHTKSTACVATLTLCKRFQGHLEYGPPGGMARIFG